VAQHAVVDAGEVAVAAHAAPLQIIKRPTSAQVIFWSTS
jgi:hypothetical protein